MPAFLLALFLGAAIAQAGPIGYACGLIKAPDHGIAGPLRLVIDPASGRARVADPMTRFYAGGPVAARAARQGKGWRLSWRLTGVENIETGSLSVDYVATLTGDGKLKVTATPEGGRTLTATGQCWAR